MLSSSLEYIIKRKTEGRLLIAKIALILGYILLFAILAIVIIRFCAPVLHIPFLLVDLAFCAMVIFIGQKLVNIEYELIIDRDGLSVTVIYGKSIRRRLLSVDTASITEFGIYDDGAYEKLCRASLQKNYLCISSLAAPEIYYALFDDKKSRSVLYFEADERAVKLLKQQNSAAFRAGNIK